MNNLYDDLDAFGELLLNIEIKNGNANTVQINSKHSSTKNTTSTKRKTTSLFKKMPKTYHFKNPILLPSN